MAKATSGHDIQSLLSNVPDNVPALWRHAMDSIKIHDDIHGNMAIVEHLSAKDLSIIWGLNRRYWKWIQEDIEGRSVEVAELIDVCWLQIDGKIAAQKLTQDMEYEVMFLVKLNNNLNIEQVNLSVTLPDGKKTENKLCLTNMPRNKLIGMTAGTFPNKKKYLGGDIKFSMMNTSSSWKSGLVVVGALIVPRNKV